jgi:hypothetical protein
MRNIVDLNGVSQKWKESGRIPKNNETAARSKYHLQARALIKEIFPTCQVIEEVAAPIRKGETLYLDFYLPLHDLCIEVHGEQHYKFVPHYHGNVMGFAKSKKRDREKVEWCENNGIQVIELPYSENVDEWRTRINER